MFRKKIPHEPVIPSPEQILEDVLNSPDDDCVFQFPNSGPDGADEKVLSDKANLHYEKVRAFVELHKNLKQSLQQLQEQSETLKISDTELKAMADDIRKQSIEALQ